MQKRENIIVYKSADPGELEVIRAESLEDFPINVVAGKRLKALSKIL